MARDNEESDDPDTENVDESKDYASFVFDTDVLTADYMNMAPKFPDQDTDKAGVQSATTTRKVKENAAPGDPVGAVVFAEDEGSDGQQESLFYRLYDDGDDTLNLFLPIGVTANSIDDEDEFFIIDRATGQISVDTDEMLDFESAEEFTVAVTATDPGGMPSQPIVVTIQVLNVNESPMFGDEDQADDENLSTRQYKEKTATTSEVSTYSATDDEDGDSTPGPRKALNWSLSGDDMAQFSICLDNDDAECGEPANYGDVVELRFKKSPDFEARADSNGDYVYNVTVQATDSDDNTATRPVVITLLNEDDPGTVTLSSIQPEAGSEISAELTDPDGGTTGITWQWKYSGTRDGNDYVDIVGATSDSYVPTSGDAIRPTFLRAVATYTDPQGADKVATSSPTNMQVQDEDADNQPPAFPDQDVNTPGTQAGQTRYVIEEVKGATAVANKDGTSPSEIDDPVMAAPDTDDNPAPPGTRKLTYSLGGSDEDLFAIASTTGQVRLGSSTMLDYETNTTYTVTVTATDPSLESDSMTLTIKVVDDDERPTLSKKGLGVSGPGTVSHPENDSADLATYKPEGSEAAGSSWSLEGADASDFSISSGGVLSFRSTPNFEAPADADSNNVYYVTVKATSGNITATRSVTINVTNVDEPGTVNLSSPGNEVKVGVQLTAELDERDEETSVSWQWARGASATGNFTNISGETNNIYEPVDADVGSFLRITVAYTDASFGPDSLSAVTATAVEAATVTVPGTAGTVSLPPSSGLVSGDPISASLTDADNPTNQVWEWERSADGSTNWTTISGATSASYTTGDADTGNYLRASVTYDDDSGTGQTAGPTATTGRVAIHRYDADANGEIERPEVINAINDFLFGDGSTQRAEVIEVINLFLFG